MTSRLTQLMVLAFVGLMISQTAVLAEPVPLNGLAFGYFDRNPPVDPNTTQRLYDLTYTPATFTGEVLPAGQLNLTNLGYFQLPNISDQKTEWFDDHFFTVVLRFEVPDINRVGGDQIPWDIVEANMEGTAHRFTPDTITFDFGHKTTLEYSNELGYGSFDLRVNDLTVRDEISGRQYLTGTIDNVVFTSYIPEPASIILLGSLLLGAGLWRKSRA